MRTLTRLYAALCALSLAVPAWSRPLVDVRLLDRSVGQELAQVRHQGRWYAAGEPGHRYAIQLHNRSAERVLAVVSVDGINIVTGESAHPQQAGYVLEPYQQATLNGWRKSLDEVAAFTFAPLPESYAARTGRPDDVGVIGVAVFREAPRWRAGVSPPIAKSEPNAESRDPGASAAAPGAADMAKSQRAPLGTGHGEREWSYASQTAFLRASSQPAQVLSIWYDRREALEWAGILPPPTRPTRPWSRPQGFPGFVPDPWTR